MMPKIPARLIKKIFFSAFLLIVPSISGQGRRCERLKELSIPNTSVVVAQTVSADAFRLSESSDAEIAQGKPFKDLPAFCRVLLVIAPAVGSKIPVELWMPVSGWNGKFLGQGNGGFAGEIDFRSLAQAVKLGYASASTDTGHASSFVSAEWALGHPQQVIDFGYRAIHEMTLKSKAILQVFYPSPLQYAYFASCSDGGREALMEAQRFPLDYDGILAGAPAYNWTRLMTNAVSSTQVLTSNPASYIPPSKLQAITKAVLTACDRIDGVADDILNDPRQCRFDPAALRCKGEDTEECLTEPQVTSLRALYSGAHDAAGKLVYPGYPAGGELGEGGWAVWILGSPSHQSLMQMFGTHYFADMVYEDPHWDYKTFSVDQGLADGLKKTASILDATDADLRPFAKRGGKLILYHGWSDPAISALSTVDYYDEVRNTVGPATEDSFLRLFMVPGMQHCGQGPGPNSFGQAGPLSASGPDDAQHDIILALEGWVENGIAPEAVIAAKFDGEGAARRITITRPLCAYPKAARYKGSGDTGQAASFACAPEQ